MARFISDKDEFTLITSLLQSILKGNPFEQNPFQREFKYFLGFEFDLIFAPFFFREIKKLLDIDSKQYFYPLQPNPEQYFYRHFESYRIIEFDNSDGYDHFGELITQDPGDSPADTLNTITNELCWFSESQAWAVLGSREWELAIIGFTNVKMKQRFIECLTKEERVWFTPVKEQIETLDSMLGFSDEIREEARILYQNYEDRE